MAGPWVFSHNQALISAVQYGQASINEGKGSIVLLSRFARIEESNSAIDSTQAGSLNWSAASPA